MKVTMTMHGFARNLAVSALLIASAQGALAAEVLAPPAGYLGAVRFKKSSPAICAPAPTPFTGTLDFPSKYEGSGSTRDELNAEAQRAYEALTLPITEMEKGFGRLVTKFMDTGNPGQLDCAIAWLFAWAQAGALQGEATSHTGRSMRKWSLGSLSGAYLRLKFSSSAPLAKYPAQSARIEAWLGTVADLVVREWPPQDPLPKFNNHYYWAAWSLIATAVVTNRHDLLDRSVAIFRVFVGQVDEEGYLPNELARGSRAAEYHAYAMQPIAMIAAFGKANDINLAAEGDRALTRLAQKARLALEDPASFAQRAGAEQEPLPPDSSSRWVWLEPYCWTVTCSPTLQARLATLRPLAVTRLGGNLTAVFAVSATP